MLFWQDSCTMVLTTSGCARNSSLIASSPQFRTLLEDAGCGSASWSAVASGASLWPACAPSGVVALVVFWQRFLFFVQRACLEVCRLFQLRAKAVLFGSSQACWRMIDSWSCTRNTAGPGVGRSPEVARSSRVRSICRHGASYTGAAQCVSRVAKCYGAGGLGTGVLFVRRGRGRWSGMSGARIRL